jgi:hypothetical protein
LQQFAFGYERVQAISQFAARFALCAQFTQELLVAGRPLGLPGDVAKDGGIGERTHLVIL